jgi:mgtE-like transporter
MPLRTPKRVLARLQDAAGPDASGLRQAFGALLIASFGGLVAGLTFGAITGTLEELPGLLVLVPAAIGMRGNIFGALGSRLGTSIHTGTFRLSWRSDTVVGQNLLAASALTLVISAAIAVLAKAFSSAFGVSETISLADFFTISVIGGVLSSVVVLGFTVGVAALCVRRDWDMDNVAAPLVTATGDMVTLPAIFLATLLVGFGVLSELVAIAGVAFAVVAFVLSWRSRHQLLRRIVRESLPILVVAGAIDIVAGLTIEHQLESFLTYPALLVLIPPFLEETGALGGVLSSRLGSKLHLGIIEARARPQRAARDDFVIIFLLAVAVFTLVAVSAEAASLIVGYDSPGIVRMVGASLLGGLIATSVAVAVAYYGSIASYRLGLDPDNFGLPLLTSSMDLVGTVALILSIIVVGIA